MCREISSRATGWFPGKVIPVDVDPTSKTSGWVGGRPAADLPGLTMVAALSGFTMALLLSSSRAGRIPKMLVWDIESGIGQRHRLTLGATVVREQAGEPDLPDRGA